MDLEQHELVKSTILGLFQENKYNVTQVGYGCKQIGNTYIEDKCIRFGVSEKLPLSALSTETTIPSSINIGGTDYITDVYVAKDTAKVATLCLSAASPNNNVLADNVIPYGTDSIINSNPNGQPNCVSWLLATTLPNQDFGPITFCGGTVSNSNIIPQNLGPYDVPIPDNYSIQICCDPGYTPTTTNPNISIVYGGPGCMPCNLWVTNYTTTPVSFGPVTICGGAEVYYTTQPNLDPTTGYSIAPCFPLGYTPPPFPGITWANTGYICTQCYSCNPINFSSTIPSTSTPPISYNRTTTRPLVGGLSMAGNAPVINGQQYYSAATLGGIVVDNITGKLVGLTNNHVAGDPGGTVNVCTFFAGDPFGPSYANYSNIPMYQNSSLDSGVVNNLSDKIGNTNRAYPLTSTGVNYVDCAVVNLDNSLLTTNSYKPLGGSINSAPPFATTSEINSITVSTPIFRSGRTLGPVGPDNYSQCVIQVCNTSTAVNIAGYTGYNSDGTANQTPILFNNVMTLGTIYPNPTLPVYSGDSGSMLYGKIGGVWKIIGLIFAGNDGGVGFAVRIDEVASLLNISAWDGTSVNANQNTPTDITLDKSYQNQASVTIGGKTYWQVGKVNY